jgi:two-component system KDP operon response regulator KdpE
VGVKASPSRAARPRLPVTCGPVASVHLVEDDPRIRGALVTALAERGHVVRASSRGLEAITPIMEQAPDVVVLDLGLPDIDGADLLRMLRGVSSVPVIIATARDDEAEIVRLLDAGADDYLVKPFSADQLEARLRAVLRRAAVSGGPERLVVGGLVVDTSARQVLLDGAVLELTRKEYELLALLARRVGQVVTREELLAEVWRQPYGGSDKTIDVHLSWLRRKLGETAAEPRYLHTTRGVGVRLVDPTR